MSSSEEEYSVCLKCPFKGTVESIVKHMLEVHEFDLMNERKEKGLMGFYTFVQVSRNEPVPNDPLLSIYLSDESEDDLPVIPEEEKITPPLGGAKEAFAKDTNEAAYQLTYSGLEIHRDMILDKVRTSSYKEAIDACADAIRGKVVLDVGCGTGILSMFAAKQDADLVVGLDAAPGILGIASRITHLNNLEDKIQFVHGKVEENQLYMLNGKVHTTNRKNNLPPGSSPFQCDVIISEWMGYALLFENMLFTVLSARDRYLRKGGLVLPGICTLHACGVDFSQKILDEYSIWRGPLYGLNLTPVGPSEDAYFKEARVIPVPKESIRTPLQEIYKFDVNTVHPKDVFFRRKCVFEGKFTSLAIFFTCAFGTSDVVLSTSPLDTPTHWSQTVMHLYNEGESLTLEGRSEITISLSRHPEQARGLDVILEIQGEAFKGVNRFEVI